MNCPKCNKKNIKTAKFCIECGERLNTKKKKTEMSEKIGKTCPYCHSVIKPSAEIVYCPSCETVHHKECWDENGGCAVYGCNKEQRNRENIYTHDNNLIDNNNRMFKYPFSFAGKITRFEFFISFIIYIVFSSIFNSYGEMGGENESAYFLYIPLLWFYWAQIVKRCHDLGKSGWWFFVPIFNPFWLFFARSREEKKPTKVNLEIIKLMPLIKKSTNVFLILLIILFFRIFYFKFVAYAENKYYVIFFSFILSAGIIMVLRKTIELIVGYVIYFLSGIFNNLKRKGLA